jgi:hypothetical protein
VSIVLTLLAGRSCPGSGVPGLDVIAEGRRCGGSLIGRWSILIGSVCMPVVRTFDGRSAADVCVEILFVLCGRIGSLGDGGADVGAYIAMDGIDIGTGGGARFGGDVEISAIVGGVSASGSVCVEMDATSGLNIADRGVSGTAIVGVAGGLSGGSTVCEELEDVVFVTLVICNR